MIELNAVDLKAATNEFISGGTPSRKEDRYWDGAIPWVTGADFENDSVILGRRRITEDGLKNSATHIVPKGSVLMVTRTGVGKVAIAPEDIAISQDITGIVPKDRYCPKYIRWSLKSQVDQMHRLQRGAIIKGIKRNDLESLKILDLHPKEQARIVELLDQADALRKLRRQADDKAARILPALFHHYFGDPLSNGKRIDTCHLGQTGEMLGGGTPSKKNPDYWNGDIPWVSPKDMKFLQIKETQDYITKTALDSSAGSLVPAASILFVFRSGILRHSAPVAINSIPVAMNQDMKAIRLSSSFSPYFVLAWAQVAKNMILSCVKGGATVQSIETSKFKSLQILKPSLKQQEGFAERYKTLIETHDQAATSKQKLEDLFQLLLHRAFTGELTATWREAHLSELVDEMAIQAKG